MSGKEKCRILRQIRLQIAQENDIELIVKECTHQGECKGVCPRCESEVRYLETELEKRRRLKKSIVLAGISIGVALSLVGCGEADRTTEHLPSDPPAHNIELEGEIAYDDPSSLLSGEAPLPDAADPSNP